MLVKRFSIICVIATILISFVTNAQSNKKFYFENISIPDGLSNTQVWDLVQDKYGFLWVSTNDGLNRYDGYEFKIFKNDPEDKTTIPNNKLHGLLIDKEGTLWISTESGLCKYDRTNETFVNFLPDSIRPNAGSNKIFNVYEDSKKRIWVATANGIFLFDRKTNKFELTYLKNKDNKTPTSGLTIPFLETSAGDIYSFYQFSNGLIKFNESTKLFERITIPKSKKWTLSPQPIISLFEDKTGKIWICHVTGLYTYDTHTNTFDKIELYKPDPANNNVVGNIYQDENGYLWISTLGQGIFRYNLRTNEITKLKQSDFPQGIAKNDAFFKFYKDNFGVLWVGTFNKGLLKLDFQKEPFRLYEKPGGNNNTNNNLSISAILKDLNNNNIVWLGTNNGFFKYNLTDKSFKKFANKKGDEKSLPSNNVNSLYQLENNGLWIGTGNGLSYFNKSNNNFTNYKLVEISQRNKISFNHINNITGDDFGNLWIGTGNGLARFDTKTKGLTYIREKGLQEYDFKLISFIDSLNAIGKPISSILKVGDYQDLKKDFSIEKKTNILLVSVGEGLPDGASIMVDYGWLTDSKNDTLFIHYSVMDGSKYLNGVAKNRIAIKTLTLNPGSYKLHYISDDSHSYGKWNANPPADSTLWGIQAFEISDNEMNKINKLIENDESKPSIVGTFVGIAKYSKDGSIIFGNDQGFSKYSISQNRIEHFEYGKNIPKTNNTKDVRDILIEGDGTIWLATMGGLIRYDQNTKEYNIFYDKNGLPSNYIQSLQEDNYGNLWVSTYNGISKFNKDIKNPIFINYDVKDGLQSYTFVQRASFKGEGGELFFGGTNGFNAFHSGNINKQKPKINITEMKINNKEVFANTEDSPLTKSILDTKDIVLNYSQNNISFDFNSIHFSRPDKNKNAYMLEGFDKDGWIYTDRNFATYTNLSEGDYVFKVKGSNGDGIWNETGTSIKIKVLPPWWRTIWAYILYFFVFVGIVFGIDRIQRRRLLVKEKEKAKLNEAELRAQIAESENERKSKELEEARTLQLSMLPKELPNIPNLDIAVYMQTATEVGGDYYDFHVGMDGTLSVVIGDATGHGLNAGTIVTATKSLFSTLATNPNILFTFSEISRCIKGMKFKRLSMCLSLLKIEGNTLKMSAAGMPPALIYRENKKELEEIMLKGMPLGSTDKFPYELSETKLGRGDTILLSSDGFPELFNENKEMFGYDRVKATFTEVADRSSEKIIEHLKNTASDWSGGKDPDDDVTFVVLKMK